MTEETATYMTAPDVNGRPSLPKRNGPRSMLPSTWLDRTLRVEYRDAADVAACTSGVLLDWCPVGIILNVRGARTLLVWDRLVLCELVGD